MLETASMKRVPLCLFFFVIFVCAFTALGQRGSQPSPGVGNAVLLATNSIQLDRDTTIVSGDVIVNNAAAGPILGEKALSLDRGVTTPAGYKIAATSIDLDSGAIVHGDAYYNTLVNQGSITGALFTPLALPVYASLPTVFVRSSGTGNVVVPDSGLVSLD